MSFIIYDIVFMVLSVLLVAIFLYTRKHNLKRQGILYLYHTKVGIKFIEFVSKKFSKILKPMQYIVVGCGYFLMVFMLGILIKFAYTYLLSPSAARDLKIPVLMPLVPYLPELFKIDFLPPFYFTYWIIIIAVIAIPHEFAHGIFARINKIKIQSTGFGFLGPFLAAFVEPDEKRMEKSPKFAQLSVLAAGTFANILVTLIFVGLIWLFFISVFSPAGVQFNTYSVSPVNFSEISAIGDVGVADWRDISLVSDTNESLINLTADNLTYFVPPALFKEAIGQKSEIFFAYDDSPALRANLTGIIIEFNGEKIISQAQLKALILTKKPGEKVQIKTKEGQDIKEYYIALGEKDGKAFLGISPLVIQTTGLLSELKIKFIKFTDPLSYQKYLNSVAYESYLGNFGIFVYYLLWWLVLVNLSVALMNMVPVGIFDGGRFFFLTIWGITGKKKVGEWAFKISTWAILAIVAAMMIKWAFAIF